MKRPIQRIVIVTADFPPIEGGISTLTLHLARELALLEREVTVVAPYFSEQVDFDATEPYRIIRYRGYQLGWLRVFAMWWTVHPLVTGADLLIAPNVASGGTLGWWWRRDLRYVVMAYAYEFLKFKPHSPGAALLRRIYNAGDVIAISGFTRDRLVEFGVHSDRIDVVHPGASHNPRVDEEELNRVRDKYELSDQPLVLAVGRFVPRKGHATLVEAMPIVLERHPRTVLILVGQGPKRDAVLKAVHRLKLDRYVLCPGRISDLELAALYQLCTVFALPTGEGKRGQVEGFGLVFSEAHAHGKPVVAGRSGGVVDAVLEGETGLIVAPDSPFETAQAIIRLLDDPALAKRLGENGRMRVERELNWRRFAQELLERLESGA